jgi:diguanylate cyclase (GGDEF)-like protein
MLKTIKIIIYEIFYNGYKPGDDDEKSRKIFLCNCLMVIGITNLVFFAILHFLNHKYYNAAFFAIIGVISFSIFFYLHFSGNVDIVSYTLLSLMAVLLLYLLITGGHDNTGPIWYFIFPPLVLYLLGDKKGTIFFAILMLISLGLYLLPDGIIAKAAYKRAFITRSTYILIVTFLMTLLYEFKRKRNISKLEDMTHELSELANTDVLTGLANRRYMKRRLEYEYKKAAWQNNKCILLMCDIDYFKSINDTHGHDCGDRVLKVVSDTFKETLRKHDIVSRWGGEEFLLLLPGTELYGGKKIAEKLCKIIEQKTIYYVPENIKVTISIGISVLNSIMSPEIALIEADKNLYKAKESGRNRVVSTI